MATATNVSTSQLASMLLSDLGAPDNAGTNKAVSIWLGGESGSNIVGNNPFNIHYDNAVSYGLDPSGKWYSTGDQAYVAQFPTIEAGMAASAKFLTTLPRYSASVAALRANNPTGFLSAIAASGWSECGYGTVTSAQDSKCHGTGSNSLLSAFGAASGPTKPGAPGAGGTTTGSATTLDQLLTKLGGGADTFSPTDTLTQSDLNDLTTLINGDGSLFLTGLPPNTKAAAQAWLATLKVGQPLGSITVPPDVFQAITGSVPSGGGFVGVGPTDPVTGQSQIVSASLPILSYIADPAHWLYIFALGIGVGMTGYGLVVLVRAYGAPDPLPALP